MDDVIEIEVVNIWEKKNGKKKEKEDERMEKWKNQKIRRWKEEKKVKKQAKK